jgi:hypothetical protein
MKMSPYLTAAAAIAALVSTGSQWAQAAQPTATDIAKGKAKLQALIQACLAQGQRLLLQQHRPLLLAGT